MKLKTAILTIGILAGSGWAQNVIDNTRNQLNAVQQQQMAKSNAALAATQGQNPKPSTPAPANAAKAPAASTLKTSTAAASTAPAGKAKGVQVVTVKVAPKTVAAPAKPVAKAAPAPEAPKPAEPQLAVAVEDKTNPADPKKDAPINMEGHRDPFVSPVVSRANGGSGCSTGKKCLAIDQINLRGVIRSDSGMIAIVVNALDKAYFLHENDPVFNGYVVKITGDSIIFKESFEDKLGKPLTREVTKRILTPAV